jgi:hypothetical protein
METTLRKTSWPVLGPPYKRQFFLLLDSQQFGSNAVLDVVELDEVL